MALGTWQVQRRAWKLDLIERVEQRVHAPAVDAPGLDQQPAVSAQDEYRHVQLRGRWLHTHETRVQAVTTLGSGFWVMTPLRRPDGSHVWVNRGFVPAEWRERDTRSDTQAASGDEVSVTGLLRLNEPGGGFLRHNDPTAQRWYSRDVQAMTQSRGLQRSAPYFVDAEAAAPEPGASAPVWPAGGLTVVSFRNSHAVYALTWYGLALMVAAGSLYVARHERQLRRMRQDAGLSADPSDDESADAARS